LIDDGDGVTGAIDTLRIAGTLTAQDVQLFRSGNDLLVRARATADQVIVASHFAAAGVEQIVFGDGTIWDGAAIAAQVITAPTEGADTITGTAGDDVINALGGADVVSGLGGADSIDGGAGNDSLNGGDGNDTLNGGSGNDTLVGGQGADVYRFAIGGGVDVINDQGTDGAADVLRLDAGITPQGVKVSGTGQITLSVVGTGDSVTFAGPDTASAGKIERIEFADGTVWTEASWAQRVLDDSATANSDSITGFAATNDTLRGLDGNDTLAGLAGNDVLDGGAGLDNLDGGNGDDVLIDGEVMAGGAGNDTYRLNGWWTSNVTVNIVITEVPDAAGNIDVLYLPPSMNPASVDVRPSGPGPYDDLFLKDKTTGNSITLPLFFNSQGSDYKVEQIRFADGTVWSVADVFAKTAQQMMTAGNDTVLGFRWADVLDGQAGNDLIAGSTGDDQLIGGAGDDTVYGDGISNSFASPSDGNDTLDGGAGNDTLYGGGGNDTYLFGRGRGSDTVTEVGGTDRVLLDAGVLTTDVTLFKVGSVLIVAIDQGPTQLAVSGQFSGTASQAIESIQFADGTVWDTAQIQARAVGGTPNAMTGTAGNDTFVVDDPGDTITEGVNQGTDTVLSSVSYMLGANLENLTLTGYLNQYAYGNTLNNVITGNAGDNVLKGNNSGGPGGRDTLIGGAGDDVYYVDGATAAFSGDANTDDTVTEAAGQGVDTVITTTLNYTLPANVENLKSTFFSVALSLVGNGLNNLLDANSSNSNGAFLDGGAGADTMRGTQGNDTYIVDDPGDVVDERGFTGIGQNLSRDTVKSSVSYTLGQWVEDLQLTGSAAISGAGNSLANVIDGSTNTAANVLAGGLGNDTYRLGIGDSAVEAPGEGTDTVVVVQGAVGTYSVASFANIENLVLTDDLGTSNLVGDGEANQLTGNGSANSLSGGGGDDLIVDGTGGNDQDSLFGGAGNDQLTSNSGADILDGGTGNDVLVGSGDVTVVFGRGYGADSWSAFGADANRRVVLNPDLQLSDLAVSRNGADLLLSFGQGDVLTIANWFVDATSTVHNGLIGAVEFSDGTRLDPQTLVTRMLGGDSNAAGAGADVLFGTSGADVFDGLAGDDRIFGSGGDDDLTGGAGNDLLVGGAGNDIYRFGRGGGQDTIVEFAGAADAVVLAAGIATTDVSVVRSGADLQIQINGTSDQATIQGFFNAATNEIESLRFSDGTVWDNATLKDLASKITGSSGADTLVGTSAADRIFGLAGNDNLSGLDGDDLLDGGTGNDTLVGGLGNDTFVVDSTGDVVTEASGQGTDTVQSSVSISALASNVENLVLTGTSPLNGAGNTLANIITGNSAANTLNGSTGADTLIGGAGDDIYVVDNAGDVLTEVAGEGTDLVQSTVSISALAPNVENLTLTGTAASGTGNGLDNVITGNGSANTLNGGAGNDRLDGGAGNDTMAGNAGNDTYVVDSTGDVVTEAANEGIDTIETTVTLSIASLANFENLTLSGTNAINGTGNGLNNVLTGNSAANTLDGGAGVDSLIGAGGNDTYVVDNTGDVVTELAGEGTDLVQSSANYTLSAYVENLTLTGANGLSGTGNGLDNVITGNSGANTLTGGAGNDRLDGGSGNDTMAGGTGNDTYVVNVGTDVVTELSGEGTDTIESTVTLSLAGIANVENLTLTGSSGLSATGNGLDNVLLGNSGANSLTGNDGNDRLDGGAGNDTMTGGLGSDTYVVNVSTDVINESAGQGTDTVESSITFTLSNAALENLTLIGTSAINGTGNTGDNVLIGNSAANTLLGLAGNDTYDGGAGNDALTDNAATGSNDTYRWGIGYGVDAVSDAGGTDTAQFGAGITAAQLVFAHVGNNLEVTISGNSADKLVISNYYVGTANRIETFRLSDGSTVPAGQVPALAAIQRETFARSTDSGIAAAAQPTQSAAAVDPPATSTNRFTALQRWSFMSRKLAIDPIEVWSEPTAPSMISLTDSTSGLAQQVQLLTSAMATFGGADAAVAEGHERMTIQPVHRADAMLVSPALM
jgi:Ca2+-binding RTX toxin-like protein